MDAEDTLLHFIYVSGGEAEGSCSQRRFLFSVWFTLLKHRAGTSWLFIPAQSREIDEGPGSVIKEFMHDVTPCSNTATNPKRVRFRGVEEE